MLTSEQKAALKEMQEQQNLTRRPVSLGMEERLFVPHGVLDHGFVLPVDYMGVDASIPRAARLSYGKGTQKVSNDQGLINYLMRHWHTSPFEMCEITMHVKLPIFVARQWIRHRTANVNEYSARYSILDREFYIPKPAQLARQSTTNNQGRGDVLSIEESKMVLEILKEDASRAYDHYEEMIDDESGPGLARELARMNLPANIYTQWYWKIDLHNLFHFLRLRADSHAQYEIRVYAETICEIVKDWVPMSYGAFEEYRLNAVHLSATMREVVKRLISGEEVTQETSGLTSREWNELMQAVT